MKAKDLMTTDLLTVSLDTPVKKLAQLLTDYEVSGAPVLDDQEKLVGIVTESDLIHQQKNLHLPTVVALFDSVLYLEQSDATEKDLKKILGSTVEDIYTPHPVTIGEDVELNEIATLMAEKKVHLLPVVRGEEVVGIVGKSDIVRAIAKLS